MASYKDIQGFNIQNLTADPDNTGAVGQIYYNSTTGTFKAVENGGIPAGTWASGGSLNSSKYQMGRAGTQTAGLIFGGSITAPATTAQTESYNGSSWTELNDLNTARMISDGGFGATNTAAIAPTGNTTTPGTGMPGAVESWNGTSWTEVAERNDNTGEHGAGGTQTDGMCFGGYGAPFAHTGAAETWNGTSWTPVSSLNTARRTTGSANGTTSAMLAMGGFPITGATETWNGSSWTEVADLNTTRGFGSGFGISTEAIMAGGSSDPPYRAQTEYYNGTSWTELNDLATARGNTGGSGSASSGFVAGGASPGIVSSTEEWNAPDVVIKTLTTS